MGHTQVTRRRHWRGRVGTNTVSKIYAACAIPYISILCIRARAVRTHVIAPPPPLSPPRLPLRKLASRARAPRVHCPAGPCGPCRPCCPPAAPTRGRCTPLHRSDPCIPTELKALSQGSCLATSTVCARRSPLYYRENIMICERYDDTAICVLCVDMPCTRCPAHCPARRSARRPDHETRRRVDDFSATLGPAAGGGGEHDATMLSTSSATRSLGYQGRLTRRSESRHARSRRWLTRRSGSGGF